MISRRSVLVFASSLGVHLSGCGLLLYPERRGQTLGRLDWTVVALDTIGLCFFFVPGLIAFAVDFATGTIFLPEGGVATNPADEHPALVSLSIPPDQLSFKPSKRLFQTIHNNQYDYRIGSTRYTHWKTSRRSGPSTRNCSVTRYNRLHGATLTTVRHMDSQLCRVARASRQ